MVFLTSIDILDTGFLSVTGRSGQLATSERVNDGSALRLKGVELEMGSSSNVDDEAYTGEFEDIEVPLVSVNPDEFKITIWLNKTSTDDNPGVWDTSDMSNLASLLRLPKTKGFKAIYYPVLNTATQVRKQDQQITTYLGRTDTSESQGDISIQIANTNTTTTAGDLTDVNYIPVRIINSRIVQDTSGGVAVVLTGKRTA